MSEFIDSFRDTLNFVIPIFEITLNGCACCLAILLLRIVNSTQLHRNCKFLLYIWTSGYIVQFCMHGALGVLNFTAEREPHNRADPALRFHIMNASGGFMFFSIVHEVLIAAERIYSSFKPETYYGSKKRYMIYLLSFTIFVFAVFQSYLINEGYHLLCGILLSFFDTLILIVNAVAVKYCKTRFLNLHGHATLNARYQVREALEIASAMQPAYISTYILKNFVNTVAIAFCPTFDDEHNCASVLFPVPWLYLESFFCTGQTIASLILLGRLLFKHPRLHRNLLLLCGRPDTRASVIDASSIVPQRGEGDVYFGMLSKSWT